MAVAIIATDTWIQHLLFTGTRQTVQGPADGMFFGVVSGDGDAGGGNVTLNGLISSERKTDFVYLTQGVSASINEATALDAFIVMATGPKIPTASAVQNPSFHQGGVMDAIANNAVSVYNRSDGGQSPFKDLITFGDPSIAGALALIAAGFGTNIDGVTYQLSVWGFLFRYGSFFRNVSPFVG